MLILTNYHRVHKINDINIFLHLVSYSDSGKDSIFMKRKCWKDKSAAYFCLLSLFTVISCQLQLSPAETSSSSLPISLLNILHSFEEYNLFCIIMIPILFAVYHYIYRSVCPPNSLHSLTVTIPAVLFSLLMLVGNSFTQAGSLSMLKGFHNGQFIKVCIKFTGSYIFFSFMIAFLYHALDKYHANYCSHQPGIKLLHHYISIINRYPFRTTFITLTLIYIPYIIQLILWAMHMHRCCRHIQNWELSRPAT